MDWVPCFTRSPFHDATASIPAGHYVFAVRLPSVCHQLRPDCGRHEAGATSPSIHRRATAALERQRPWVARQTSTTRRVEMFTSRVLGDGPRDFVLIPGTA